MTSTSVHCSEGPEHLTTKSLKNKIVGLGGIAEWQSISLAHAKSLGSISSTEKKHSNNHKTLLGMSLNIYNKNIHLILSLKKIKLQAN
jgi:hypothetical protein